LTYYSEKNDKNHCRCHTDRNCVILANLVEYIYSDTNRLVTRLFAFLKNQASKMTETYILWQVGDWLTICCKLYYIILYNIVCILASLFQGTEMTQINAGVTLLEILLYWPTLWKISIQIQIDLWIVNFAFSRNQASKMTKTYILLQVGDRVNFFCKPYYVYNIVCIMASLFQGTVTRVSYPHIDYMYLTHKGRLLLLC